MILQRDRMTQSRKRVIEVFLSIRDLAVEHRLRHRKLLKAEHVVHAPRFRHPVTGGEELRPCLLRLDDFASGSVGDALGVAEASR